MDPKDAHTAALKREVQLLRAENAYLRGQLSSAASLGDSSALQMTLATSESSLTAMPSQRPSTGKAAASNQAPAEVGQLFLPPMTSGLPRLETTGFLCVRPVLRRAFCPRGSARISHFCRQREAQHSSSRLQRSCWRATGRRMSVWQPLMRPLSAGGPSLIAITQVSPKMAYCLAAFVQGTEEDIHLLKRDIISYQ